MLGQLRKPKGEQQEIGAVGVFGMNDGSFSSQVPVGRLGARRTDKLNVLISDISRITISRHVAMSMKGSRVRSDRHWKWRSHFKTLLWTLLQLAKHMCLSLTFSSVRVCVFAMLIVKHAMSNSQPLPGTDPAA